MSNVAPLAFAERPRPLLLYILGWGRSGSSIMANILGSMKGGASLGEVRYLWDRGLLDNGICGCGENFAACPFWPDLPMGTTRLGDLDPERARSLARRIGSGARYAQVPALHSTRARASYFKRNRDDLKGLMDLYAAAFASSGANVIVDASKSPFYGVNLLYPERPFDVAFLHLVRDPRAVLHSWKKAKQRRDNNEDTPFPRYSSTRSLTQWAIVNSRCELLGRLAPDAYFQVRYEDFADNWRAALLARTDGLFDTIDGAEPGDARMAKVTAQHSISGNPSRFSVGDVHLKPDTSWRDAVTPLDRRMASFICGSVARRYGYEVSS